MPARGAGEPTFRPAPAAVTAQHVLPGNKEFLPGDRIPKPEGGAGGTGTVAGTGGSEDDFQFMLSREEVLDLFFEDLELPDMVKLNLKETVTFKPRRVGFTTAARRPTSISVAPCATASAGAWRCSGRAKGRSRRSPTRLPLSKGTGRLAAAQSPGSSPARRTWRLERRRRRISYVDPVDVRFNRFERQPVPNANAVMFCLMDVSGSMGEREKDLAKRFFVLLHLFLKRRYERIDIVFIRHTDEAREVDEETFFYSKQSGGTVVSTALEEMLRIIEERYPAKEWNIYAAQASDGDNSSGDSERCAQLLRGQLMRLCQYYAYVEIIDEREKRDLRLDGQRHLALARLSHGRWRRGRISTWPVLPRPADIYPVFRKLFSRQPACSAQLRENADGETRERRPAVSWIRLEFYDAFARL
jgi:uncharacterized sporulation protein YeaH/YhbH (DUF444 family)